MLKFVLFLFISFFAVLFILGFSIAKAYARLTGKGNKTGAASSRQTSSSSSSNRKKHPKIFPADEGEYIEFEEISDTPKN